MPVVEYSAWNKHELVQAIGTCFKMLQVPDNQHEELKLLILTTVLVGPAREHFGRKDVGVNFEQYLVTLEELFVGVEVMKNKDNAISVALLSLSQTDPTLTGFDSFTSEFKRLQVAYEASSPKLPDVSMLPDDMGDKIESVVEFWKSKYGAVLRGAYLSGMSSHLRQQVVALHNVLELDLAKLTAKARELLSGKYASDSIDASTMFVGTEGSEWSESASVMSVGRSKGRGPKCFKCQEYGHIAANCPNRHKARDKGGTYSKYRTWTKDGRDKHPRKAGFNYTSTDASEEEDDDTFEQSWELKSHRSGRSSKAKVGNVVLATMKAKQHSYDKDRMAGNPTLKQGQSFFDESHWLEDMNC